MVDLPAENFFTEGLPSNLQAKEALDNMVEYARGGLRQIWIGAGAMIPLPTAGPTRGVYNQAANATDIEGLEYSGSVNQWASFALRMPKSWNLGAFAFRPRWCPIAGGTGDVVWDLYAFCSVDGGAFNSVAPSSQATSTDTAQTGGVDHEGPLSTPAVPPAPAVNNFVQFRIGRYATSGADTLTTVASLIGITLEYTANAGNDA